MKFQGRRKIAILMLFAVLFMNLIPVSNGTGEVIITPMVSTAEAATVTIAPGGFSMVADSQNVENGKLITMTGSQKEIGLAHSSGSIPTDVKVQWLPYDEHVINVSYTSNYKAIVTAVGPGYSQLAAIISYEGMDYQVYCQIYVPLEIDVPNNVSSNNFGLVNNLSYGDGSNNVGFQLKYDGSANDFTHYLVKLKNVQYQNNVTNHAVGTPSAITATQPAITWTSSDESVVKVDESGILTASGSGYAIIKVETTTVYNNKTDSISFPVFVAPTGQVSTSSAAMTDYFEFTATSNSFTINTNAAKSSNLTWTIHKGADKGGEVIDPKKSNLMNLTLSEYSGSATFTDVKAGTYYITARPTKDFSEDNSFIKNLEFKVVVPIFFGHSSITMNVGDYYDILANSNLPDKSWYNYSSDNGTVATVSPNGLITGVGSGLTLIQMYATAPGIAGGAVDQTMEVKVVDGIGLNTTNATIYTGSTLQLVLTASNNSAPITWTSSDKTVASVNEDGLVTGLKPGSAVITVEQKIDGVVKRLTCNIRVIQTVTSITLNPSKKDIAIGDNLTINATVEPKINNVKLHWVTSDSSVVAIKSSDNLSTTVTGVNGGVAVITAINQDNVIVGSCLINVFQPIKTITLSETSVSVPLSDRWFQLYASIEPYAAKDQEIVWQSSDPSILTVDTHGKVTLKKAGKASVIATSKVDASVTAICNVIVTKSVTGITLDYTSRDMYVGETFRLTYVVKPSDSSNAAVTWSSSNSSVASVDKSGLVSAKSVGTAVIILKANDGGYIATCTIKVSRTATAVKLDVTDLTMNVGDYYYLETTLTPADSTESTLSWESSDKKVATVSKTGKVIAKSAGKAIIMVKTKSGSTGYCNLTVLQPVTGIQISSSKETISVGEELKLKARILPTTANDDGITWESSDESVATVDENGRVIGVGGGVAMISVTSDDGNYKDYCMVTVEEMITSIKLSRTSYRLGLGRTFTLTAKINGEKATNKQLKWSSSNTSIATVDQNGRVKGKKLGIAIITAKATDGSGAEATCRVRVTRLVTSIDLDVTYLTLVQGKSHKLKATVYPSNATFKTPTYTTSNADVAIVNKNGTITGLTPGNAIITAKAKDSSGVKAICYVKVIAPVASTGISISESEVVMSPGETKTVAISIVPNNSTDTYTWSSDNNLVANVNSKTGKITAKAIGTANITVMTESGRKGSIKVYVVGLSKTNVELHQYTSTLISLEVDGAGSSNLKVRWDVENQEIATVVKGKVTGKAIGTTYVYAVVNGRRLTCKVTVTKIP